VERKGCMVGKIEALGNWKKKHKTQKHKMKSERNDIIICFHTKCKNSPQKRRRRTHEKV
jgi:hypothetical protein